MDDTRVRRHDPEITKRVLAPAQKRVAFLIALKFDRRVLRQRLRRAVPIDLDRMIDDQFGGGERVDPVRMAAERHHGVAHRREVHDGRYAGEVLHDHAGRRECDFLARRCGRIPVRQGTDIIERDVTAVGMAQQVFEQDLQRERQSLDVTACGLQFVNLVVGTADGQDCLCVNCLRHGGSPCDWPLAGGRPAQMRRAIITEPSRARIRSGRRRGIRLRCKTPRTDRGSRPTGVSRTGPPRRSRADGHGTRRRAGGSES